MNFAIRYPSRLDKYIACDCNVASSDNNSKAWVGTRLPRAVGGWLVQVGQPNSREMVQRRIARITDKGRFGCPAHDSLCISRRIRRLCGCAV